MLETDAVARVAREMDAQDPPGAVVRLVAVDRDALAVATEELAGHLRLHALLAREVADPVENSREIFNHRQPFLLQRSEGGTEKFLCAPLSTLSGPLLSPRQKPWPVFGQKGSPICRHERATPRSASVSQ